MLDTVTIYGFSNYRRGYFAPGLLASTVDTHGGFKRRLVSRNPDSCTDFVEHRQPHRYIKLPNGDVIDTQSN